MKLLILNWGAYTQRDITETLIENHIICKTVNYCFADKNNDSFFISRFSQYIKETQYDAVFTVNYFPLIAEICYQYHIKYLSWSYDNPLNVLRIEETLAYETNYVFLFDRIQAEHFKKQGYKTVYHLPLAVNTNRLDKIILTPGEQSHFGSEISFVGKLYPSTFPELVSPLSEHSKGYLDAIVKSQLQIYGYYFVDELLTPLFMEKINQEYADKFLGTEFYITKKQLSYSLSSYITREERLLLLGLLSRHHLLKLYSRENLSILDSAVYMGSAKYLSDMPKIFKASQINLNITLKILQSGIPLRVMDILGAKGFLISNYQPELVEYFLPETDFVMYDSIEDAADKANFYLHHEDLRLTIASNGHKKVSEQFNYTKQLKKLFEISGLH
jgi:spore maturation protein CgeB